MQKRIFLMRKQGTKYEVPEHLMFLLEQAGGIQFSPRETCQRHNKFPPGKRPKALKGGKCKECRTK